MDGGSWLGLRRTVSLLLIGKDESNNLARSNRIAVRRDRGSGCRFCPASFVFDTADSRTSHQVHQPQIPSGLLPGPGFVALGSSPSTNPFD